MVLTDDDAVRSHMGALHRAFREGDVATLDRVLANEFAFTDPDGPVMSKERWLADIASGSLVFDAVETGPVTVRHLGDRVVVDGEARLSVRYTESDYNGRFRYLGVFVREGDAWRLSLTSARRLDR